MNKLQNSALDKILNKLKSADTIKFENDLKAGQKSEKKFLQYLLNQNIKAKTTEEEGYFPDYDIIATINNNQKTFEIKTDFQAIKTGNIAIELYNYNSSTNTYKNTGINKTKADYYVYCISNKFYLFRTELLQILIKNDSKNYSFRIVHDTKNKIALFKKDYLLNYSIELNESEDIIKQLELTNLQLQNIIVKFN